MIALIAAVALVGPDAAKQQLKDVADRLHDTVIEVRSSATVAGVQVPTFGAGVLIGGGLALTTLHTVSAGASVEVLVQGSGSTTATMVGGFPQVDLALLRIDAPGALPSAPLAEEAPAVGAPLIAMGAGEDTIEAVGVNVLAREGDLLLLGSTRPVDSRYWGGPLFDAAGRLVAVSVASLALPRAVTASAIRALLQRK